MRATIPLFIAAVMAISATCQSQAATLQPGVYKMEWRTDDSVPGMSRVMIAGQLSRTQSSDPFVGYVGGCKVVVSGSTDDRAVQMTPPGAGVAVSIPFDKAKDLFISDPGSAVKVVLGHAPNEVVEEAPIWVWSRDLSPGSLTGWVRITWQGGWIGKIKTDSGEIEVSPICENRDGDFDDKLVFPPKDSSSTGDHDAIIFKTGRAFGFSPTVLGKAVRFDDKLYDISVSPSGDTVTVAPFKGDTGTVRFNAKNGNGGVAYVASAGVIGVGGEFHIRDEDEAELPVGDYVLGTAQVDGTPGMDKTARPGVIRGVRISYHPDIAFKVQKNRTCEVVVGGPLCLETTVSPFSKNKPLRRGSMTGGHTKVLVGEIPTIFDSRGLTNGLVELIDSVGKVVVSSPCKLGLAGSGQAPMHSSWTMGIPLACPPGDYKLRVSFEAPPYQDKVTGEQAVTVK